MLDAQNFYRGEHNASALSWNKSSASVAGKWSSACNFVHSVGFLSSFPFSSPQSLSNAFISFSNCHSCVLKGNGWVDEYMLMQERG